MPSALLRLCDLILLAAAAALFGACLTSLLTTGAYGWAVPDAPYVYTPRDFYADAVLAGVAGLLLSWALERLTRARLAAPGRALLFLAAALLALYLAPPAPVVFGNTWGPGEATRELFLAQWRLVLPIAVATTAARWALWRLAGRRQA